MAGRLLPFALVSLGLLSAGPAHAAAQAGIVPGDYCNARGERVAWSSEAKGRTLERVRAGVRDLGVSRAIEAYHLVIVCREAFCGEASVRHVLGEDVLGREDGLGPYGLSLRWHAGKWPGGDVDPAFCTPEVSVAVAHEIMWRAVTRYGARNLAEVQAVYAGAVTCDQGDCRFHLSVRARRGLRDRLAKYGVDPYALITVEDLGRRIDEDDRREWALTRARQSLAAWLGR